MGGQPTAAPVAEFLSPKDLAELLNVPIGTVYRWNYDRSGPPSLRVGRHVRYRRADVDLWLDARSVPEVMPRSGRPVLLNPHVEEWIADVHAEGWSPVRIARALNHDGYVTARGRPWTTSAVQTVIRSITDDSGASDG